MWKTPFSVLATVFLIQAASAQEDPIDLINHLDQPVIISYYNGLMVEQTDTLKAGETAAIETGGASPVRLNSKAYILWPGDEMEIHPDKNRLKLTSSNASRTADLLIWERMEAAIQQRADRSPEAALRWLKSYSGKMSPQMRMTSQEFLEAYQDVQTAAALPTIQAFASGSNGQLTAAQKWLLRNWFETQPHGDLQACLDQLNAGFHGEALDYLFTVAAQYYTAHPEINSGLEYMFSKLDASHRQYFDHYVLNDYFPNTVFRFSHHEHITRLRDSSLKTDLPGLMAQYAGRPVYIDFWASWCLPCRKEMPAWKALKEEFAAKGIAFVSISIDTSPLQWERMAIALDSAGHDQYLISGNDQVMRILGLTSIPRYIMLNANHQILTSRAPRPSDPGARAMLQRLVGE